MIGYYDMILGLVGSLLIGGAIAAAVLGTAAIIAAALFATALVGHAMFVKPPIDEERVSQATVNNVAD